MKVLIIGGTKFVGKAIAEKSLEAGHEVTLFNRGKTDHSLPVNSIVGDVENLPAFKTELLKQNLDVVVHCIAFTEKHAQDVVEVFKGTKTKVIVLSSCDCYEAFQGLNRNKDNSELPIDEESETSLTKYYWSDSAAKGSLAEKYDKNLMTDILMSAFKSEEINTTIFRLPMVYGDGDYQYAGRHGNIIRRILDKEKNIVLSDREQCQLYTYGYIGNIAAAIVHSFNKPVTNGKIYNLGESKTRSKRKWVEFYGKTIGWNFEVHVLPEELIRKDKDLRNANPLHLLIDSSLYERETGFTEPYSLEESIKRTFDFAKENPDRLGEKPNYLEELELVKKYNEALESLYSF